jgi:hypothetical protein
MDLVRALTLQTLKYNFYFKAFHVPGHIIMTLLILSPVFSKPDFGG